MLGCWTVRVHRVVNFRFPVEALVKNVSMLNLECHHYVLFPLIFMLL
jgi:hypothetical protein